jgi:hypothetical protein
VETAYSPLGSVRTFEALDFPGAQGGHPHPPQGRSDCDVSMQLKTIAYLMSGDGQETVAHGSVKPKSIR